MSEEQATQAPATPSSEAHLAEGHAAEGHTDSHVPSDTVVLMGRSITVPGGIYTVVFVGLAVLTLIELVFGTAQGDWRIPVLLALALAKATLVVLFYMHLRTDSRIFAVVLLIPLAIAVVSLVYLLSVPVGY